MLPFFFFAVAVHSYFCMCLCFLRPEGSEREVVPFLFDRAFLPLLFLLTQLWNHIVTQISTFTFFFPFSSMSVSLLPPSHLPKGQEKSFTSAKFHLYFPLLPFDWLTFPYLLTCFPADNFFLSPFNFFPLCFSFPRSINITFYTKKICAEGIFWRGIWYTGRGRSWRNKTKTSENFSLTSFLVAFFFWVVSCFHFSSLCALIFPANKKKKEKNISKHFESWMTNDEEMDQKELVEYFWSIHSKQIVKKKNRAQKHWKESCINEFAIWRGPRCITSILLYLPRFFFWLEIDKFSYLQSFVTGEYHSCLSFLKHF